MRNLIIILFLLFSICSYGQVPSLQKAYNRSIALGQEFPTINAHGNTFTIDSLGFYDITVHSIYESPDKYTDNTVSAGYWTLNTGEPTDDAYYSSDITLALGTLNFSGYKIAPTQSLITAVTVAPSYFKIQANNYDSLPVTFVMHPPTMDSITITDIAVWDADTLKKVHLATPLTVQGFKTLITKK